MKISRRQFLSLCAASGVVAMGGPLAKISAGTTRVVWLQGSGCSGCSVSFLNYIAPQAPETVTDVLLDIIQLQYHPTLMSGAGELAVNAAEEAYNGGGYYLVMEGGIPTAMNGAACWAWSVNGHDVTFQEVVSRYAGRAGALMAVGNCASFGGMSAAAPNPMGVLGLNAFLKTSSAINVAGCPPHPDWIVWTLSQLLSGNRVPVDSYNRPSTIFGRKIHDRCPRRESEEADRWGVDRECLKELGCRGPQTRGNCPTLLWNNRTNWCVDANSLCIGCTEPNFPVVGMSGEAED